MARADRVSLTFEADLGPLIKRLKEIPDLTGAEVRRATSALRKGTKALQRDARVVRQSAAEASDGVKRIGEASGDAESSLRAVAGVIGLVSPEAERALSSVAELGGGLEGVTRATELFGGGLGSVLRIAGPVGVAVAALGVAHVVLSRQVEQAEQAMKDAAAAATTAQTAFGATSDVVTDLERDFALLSGAISEDALALQEQQQQIRDRFLASRRALEGQIAALEEQKEAVKASNDSAAEQSKQLDAINNRISRQTGALGALNDREERALFLAEANSDLRNQEDDDRKRATDAANEQAEALAKLIALREQLTPTADPGTFEAFAQNAAAIEASYQEQLATIADIEKTLGDAVDAEELRNAALAERDRLLKKNRADQQAMINAQHAIIDGIREELTVRNSFEKRERQINDQYQHRIDLIDEHEARMGVSDDSQAARAAAEAARASELAENQAAQLAYVDGERQRYHEAQLQREEQEAAQRAANLNAYGSALGTFAGGVAAASGVAAEQMADDNREAAERMFAISKTAAISQALINGAVAVTQALAQLGPIAGAIAAVGIAGTVGAQVAVIASQEPSFNDTPGPISLPRGGSASFAAGDLVVAGKDLGDMRRQIDAADSRQRAPVVQVVGIPLYEGRTYDRARRDAYRRPGPDSRALQSLRRSGQGSW